MHRWLLGPVVVAVGCFGEQRRSNQVTDSLCRGHAGERRCGLRTQGPLRTIFVHRTTGTNRDSKWQTFPPTVRYRLIVCGKKQECHLSWNSCWTFGQKRAVYSCSSTLSRFVSSALRTSPPGFDCERHSFDRLRLFSTPPQSNSRRSSMWPMEPA